MIVRGLLEEIVLGLVTSLGSKASYCLYLDAPGVRDTTASANT